MKSGRKRKVSKGEWVQEVAKSRRQRGLEYKSYKTKKTVPKRVPGPPCKDGCFDKVGEEGRAEIFKNCWEIGSYDGRLNYFNGCVSDSKFKRKYTKKEVSLRPMRIVYSVKYAGTTYEVCRAGFQAIHGLTDKELRVFLEKRKQSATGPLASDQRGRHPPARKIVGSQLAQVHEHISMLSVTTSHYSRIKNPHRQYAPENLSIPILHGAYEQWMFQQYPGEPKVKFSFYKKIFTTCYNIAFKPPQTDVCNQCTEMKMEMKSLEGVEERADELDDLQEQYEMHVTSAKEAQDLLRKQKDDTDDDLMVIAVDLQQTLPCPKLSVNRAYYTRKVWLYNLCVYDVKAQKPYMYVWDESQGGRKANDVASCVNRWLKDNANGRRKLRMFADNCAGQNKNRTMVLMALQKIHSKELSRVEFIYLVSGHSYLPCDRSFGNIERRLKVHSSIETPRLYVDAIESSVKEKPIVTVMKIPDFFNFTSLENYCTWRTPTTVKKAFRTARQFVVSDAFPQGYAIKLHYRLEDVEASMLKVSLSLTGPGGKGKGRGKGRGRGRPAAVQRPSQDFNLSTVVVPRNCLGDVVKVEAAKLKDLALLKPYMSDMGRQWIEEFLEAQKGNVRDLSTASAEPDDPDDPDAPDDDYAMDYEEVRRITDA